MIFLKVVFQRPCNDGKTEGYEPKEEAIFVGKSFHQIIEDLTKYRFFVIHTADRMFVTDDVWMKPQDNSDLYLPLKHLQIKNAAWAKSEKEKNDKLIADLRRIQEDQRKKIKYLEKVILLAPGNVRLMEDAKKIVSGEMRMSNDHYRETISLESNFDYTHKKQC